VFSPRDICYALRLTPQYHLDCQTVDQPTQIIATPNLHIQVYSHIQCPHISCSHYPSCPQDLNPLPFVGTFANCTAWLLYGTLTKDPYVYFSNILGLPLGFFFIFTSLKFAPEKVRRA